MKLLPIFALFFAANAHGGGISSTGGENHAPADGAAWFLGEAPVRYCLEVSANFGSSTGDVGAQVDRALKTWRNYYLDKTRGEPSDEGTDANIEEWMHLGSIDTNFYGLSKCDGSEDLHFYFGVTGSEVKDHVTEFANPYAFAQRTSFDKSTGRGKGFIWVQSAGVAPVKPEVWKKPFLLYGVILHEIGHVFGNSHVGETIMDERIPAIAGEGGWKESGEKDQGVFTHIDNRRELYFCRTCDFDYVGKSGDPKADPLIMPNGDMFSLLTGRQPVGAVKSRIFTQDMQDLMHRKIFLELRDDQGKFTLALDPGTFLSPLTMTFGDSPVFKKSKGDNDWSRASNSESYLVKIVTKKGKRLPALLTRNMGVSPVALQLLSVRPGWVPWVFSSQTY